MKIREAMFDKDHRELLTGVVEVEETYIGGKPRKQKVVSHDLVEQKKLLLWNGATWRAFKSEKLKTIICLLQ
ncbi:MAG: hypothetical protein V3U40_07210 [Candidatus Scalindua sediminis]